MPFNKDVSGFENEFEFARYLNNKKVRETNPLFQELFENIYNDLSPHSIITAWIDFAKQKNDLFIKIEGITKRISIKKGVKNSVHVEHINSFISFLKDLNIKDTIIDDYLKYHYADGTLNGTGDKRLSVQEYKENHQDEIDNINKILNTKEILQKATNRFILSGRKDEYEVDAMIYGIIEDFLWITNKEIKEIVLNKKDDYSTAVHFGPLTIQPMARCLNYNHKYEHMRHFVQVKWYNISDNIIEYMAFHRK